MQTVSITTEVQTLPQTSMHSEKTATLREYWREKYRQKRELRILNGFPRRPVGRPRKPRPGITEVCTQVSVSQEQQPSL